MTAECIDCGRYFDARGDWQTRCLSCFKTFKAATDADAAYRDGYLAGMASMRRVLEAERKRTRLDPDFAKKLVRLTHPDRHPPERAEDANAVTAALLEMVK